MQEETWSDDLIDDLDAKPDVRKVYAFHRGCKERDDYEFERGWDMAKYGEAY